MTHIITNLKLTFCVFITKSKEAVTIFMHLGPSYKMQNQINGPNGEIVLASPMI